MQPRFRLLGLIPGREIQPKPPARVAIEELSAGSVRSLIPGRLTLTSVDFAEIASISVSTPSSTLLNRVHEGPEREISTGSDGPRGMRLAEHQMPREDPLRAILTSILQPPIADLTKQDGILEWPHELLPYQREGVQALVDRPQLLLADDMGLGKTIQVLAALRILFQRGDVRRVLIVAPASLLRQWRKEATKWAPELRTLVIAAPATERAALWRSPAHVYIVGYETIRKDVSPNHPSPATRKPWDVVVLDEASKIKNRDSQVAKAVKLLPRRRRWALTGTPLENRIDDVYSILEFILNESAPVRPLFPSVELLREFLREHQLRRRKVDVLKELPPKTVENIFLDLLPAQREAYDLAEAQGIVQLRARGAKVTITHILELIMRLKQLCNVDPASGQSSKIEDIVRRLASLIEEGHRALLFSQFTDEHFGVAFAANRLRAFMPLTYTGSMSAGQRVLVEEQFTNNSLHKVLMLSLKAGGMGLNLQSASYVFHLDRWWNPATEDQAEARSHRMGQKFPVTVYRYTCAKTIEERIENILETKRELFRDVIDDVTLDMGRVLSRSDIFGLFGLQPPVGTPFASTHPVFGTMSGTEFECWLAERLREQGYKVESTPRSHDGGIDLIASRMDLLGIESRCFIQCKNLTNPVAVSVVRELIGAAASVDQSATLIVAAPSGFTSEAKALARPRGVLLWDAKALESLISHPVED